MGNGKLLPDKYQSTQNSVSADKLALDKKSVQKRLGQDKKRLVEMKLVQGKICSVQIRNFPDKTYISILNIISIKKLRIRADARFTALHRSKGRIAALVTSKD